MGTISVTVADETHGLARIKAAETGTTVAAMMWDKLLPMLTNRPIEGQRRPSQRDGPGSWAKCLRNFRNFRK